MIIATEITRLQNAKADLKTAIESKGVTVGDGLIDTYAEKIDEIPTGGSDERFTALWNGLLNKGARTDNAYLFRHWKNAHDYWYPPYPLQGGTMMFYGFTSNLGLPEMCERAGIPQINWKKISTFNQNFSYASMPDAGIVDMTSASVTGSCFMYSDVKKAHIILKEDGSQKHTGGCFTGATSLTDLTIEGAIGNSFSVGACPLNKQSIYNVFNVLLSTVTGQTVTVKKAAVNKAFETSEGANDGSTSDEWNSLVASKPNWTVSLS